MNTCPCCHQPLAVIEQPLPRRTLRLVTCWNVDCIMFGLTLSEPEHQRQSAQVSADFVRQLDIEPQEMMQ